MRITIIIFFILSLSSQVSTQKIVTCGEITFEKKESTLKKLKETKDEDEDSGWWYDEMIKNSPKFTIDKFTLKFDETRSEYQYVKPEVIISKWGWSNDIASKNHVYKDFSKKETVTMKQVFEEDVIFKDSLRQFKWKISNEFREIAGYDCRKATTIINDSLYVIAFYTDQIELPTGPESFGGLPGTILGVVMPRMYLTWFATNVKTDCKFAEKIKSPSKGKTRSKESIEKLMSERFGQYKKWFTSLMWAMAI